MKVCEHSRSIADCAACGGGAAAGIYWVGAGGGERADDSWTLVDAPFTGTQGGGIDYAWGARFAGRDFRMVLAGGNCGECRVLLCDFLFAGVFGYSPTRSSINKNPSFARGDAFFEAPKSAGLKPAATKDYAHGDACCSALPDTANSQKWLCHS